MPGDVDLQAFLCGIFKSELHFSVFPLSYAQVIIALTHFLNLVQFLLLYVT